MKKKNGFLAIAAFTFAVGSAFASFLTPEAVYVRAVFSQGADWVCTDVGVQCDTQGSEVCQVQVPLQNGTTQLVSTTGTKKPYRGTACTTALSNTSASLLISPLTGSGRPISIQ